LPNRVAAANPGARIALVGATLTEARAVMAEGESGVLALHHAHPPEWEPLLRKLTWHNGSVATLYSAAEPESLRGPQHNFAWADEIAKWPLGIAAWDNLMLGLRLGARPQVMATTTPRPVPLVRRLVDEKGVAISRGKTLDNVRHLPPEFIEGVAALYGGTRWGRQELDGELIEDVAGALWSRDLLERQRVIAVPDFKRIVIGVDPPVSADGDACGIVAVGLGRDDKAYVLADHSVKGASPEGWARAVAAAVEAWGADRVVAEDNQGGNMVESTLRAANVAMPVKRVYDAAATAAFGALSVGIPNIAGPKTAAQNAMLDRAGELLAASTASVIAAVRDEAGPAGATAYLLVYLPTVLDPLAPEAKRANVPLGWASPAFDILQLEDYDWVTSGNHGATARAVPMMSARLGYPVAHQHYFAGFVLAPASKAQWAEIDLATELSARRGTARTYVWALPQVARDGYTHFRIGEEEDDMQAFDDVTFPIEIGREAMVTAEFSTNVVTTFSGHERRNSDWADARQKYDVGPGVRSEQELGVVLSFFRARRGPAIGFRFTDPFDNSSNDMTGVPTALDQLLGIGDGVRTSFALIKTYGADGQIRRVTRPRPGTVIVASNGNNATGWALTEPDIIQFETAPAIGAAITAGFRFDVPVRFADDSIEMSRATFGAADIPSVPLIEIKEAS
jgi:uncharacterized protein (TIGR02217 family)